MIRGAQAVPEGNQSWGACAPPIKAQTATSPPVFPDTLSQGCKSTFSYSGLNSVHGCLLGGDIIRQEVMSLGRCNKHFVLTQKLLSCT